MESRLPPRNVLAERSVLGSILRENSCLQDVIDFPLRQEDFYVAAHQALFAACRALADDGKPIDLVTLADYLKAAGQIEDVGSYDYLAELWDVSPSAANVMYYAEIVRDKALNRHLIHSATEIIKDAYDESEPAKFLLDNAEKSILEIGNNYASHESATLQQLMIEAQKEIDNRVAEGKPSGMQTGFIDIDKYLCGLMPSEFSVLAAYTSVGKTSLMAQIGMNIARHGDPVLIISLEQAKLELAQRMIFCEGKVDSYNVKQGKLASGDMDKIMEAAGEMSKLPLYIDDVSMQTAVRIAAKARRHKKKYGIKLLLIDYLQIIHPEDMRVHRVEQMDSICRRLKSIAKELKIHVCACAQLNRQSQDDDEPGLRHLREGGIEMHVDVAALMWRKNNDVNQGSVANFVIAKNRNGKTGKGELAFLKQYTRFENYAASVPGF